MLKSLAARTHIALGQSFLLTTMLLVAVFLGLVPDRDSALRGGRAALAEAVAANGSALMTRADTERLAATLRLVVERNDDLLSAALRRADGQPIITIGDHDANWSRLVGDYSTESQISVPIWSAGQRWGRIELRFAPIGHTGVAGLLLNPIAQLVAFLGLTCFLVFRFYLGRMLRQLDPSRAVPQHVRSALDTLAEGLLVIDMKQSVVLANQAFAATVGRSPDELVGIRASAIGWVDAQAAPIDPDDVPWAKALADGERQRDDLMHLVDSESRRRTFIVNCSPVLGNGGKHGGVLISLDDVTQLEANKVALQASKEEAEAANRAKSEFLANMSHEIRTPMNAILGFTEVLKRGYGSSERERGRYLDTIHSSGSHLLQLINDLLDLSKVEAGHLELETLRFAPHAVAFEVAQVLAVKAHEKGISLEVEVDGTVPETIESDPTRLRQIITNLVSNAVKFTAEGGVRVLLDTPRGEHGPMLRLRIVDSGVGVPRDKLESIFDPFVQADSTVTRKFGGTGLGLAISRRFARMMGGDVVAERGPEGGSVFVVTIAPGSLEGVRMLEPGEAAAAAEATSAAEVVRWTFPPDKRVLVVDDGAENRELVRLVLGEAGLQVDEASNGREALSRALADSFDLVLMDVQMPVMDGFTAAGHMRTSGLEIPIIALTANAMEGYEQICLDAGYSGLETKPVDIDHLLETLAGLLGGHQATSAIRGTGPQPEPAARLEQGAEPRATAPGASEEPVRSRLAGRSPRVDVTIGRFAERLGARLEAMENASRDGDFRTMAGLGHWLKGAGGTVGFDVFNEPAEALEAAAAASDQAGVARIVAELRALHGRLECPHGPTAGQPVAEIATRAPPDTPVSLHPNQATKPSTPPAPGATPAPLVSRLVARNPRFKATAARFAERLRDKLESMDECQVDGNLDTLAELAHWLKGAGGTVGFDEFTEPAERLEALVRAHRVADIHDAIEELREMAGRIELEAPQAVGRTGRARSA